MFNHTFKRGALCPHDSICCLLDQAIDFAIYGFSLKGAHRYDTLSACSPETM